MVKVFVEYKDNYLHKIVVKGHANSAPKGEDLICAAVSAISVGTLEALDQLSQQEIIYEMNSGLISIQVNEYCKESQLILNTMLIQLKLIQESYKQYINIQDCEV